MQTVSQCLSKNCGSQKSFESGWRQNSKRGDGMQTLSTRDVVSQIGTDATFKLKKTGQVVRPVGTHCDCGATVIVETVDDEMLLIACDAACLEPMIQTVEG